MLYKDGLIFNTMEKCLKKSEGTIITRQASSDGPFRLITLGYYQRIQEYINHQIVFQMYCFSFECDISAKHYLVYSDKWFSAVFSILRYSSTTGSGDSGRIFPENWNSQP